MRQLLLSSAFVLVSAAAAHAAVQDAFKICTDRYNAEKSSGTIPVGMSKSTYMNQCTGSIRRAAKLEKQLAEDKGDAGTDQSGSNEVTASTAPAKPTPTTSKPAHVLTAPGPKGS
jgi:hypothetical protein